MNELKNYRATISFSFTPFTECAFDMNDIQEAAMDYMAKHIADFGGLGISETYELLELYAKRRTALVTFVVMFATRDGHSLDCISDSFTDLGGV